MLFASYVFVFIVAGRWHAIDSTPGVLKIIRFGEAPARCPDREVESIMALVDEHGFVRLPERPLKAPRRVFAKGEAVKIVAGPFAGKAGLWQGQTTRQRELILLAMLGAARTVAVPASSIAAQ